MSSKTDPAPRAPSAASWWRRLARASSTFERAAFIAIIVLLVACSLSALSWPLGYDQGIFAWAGRRVASGGAPYVDAWDQKGPLVFVLFAAVLRFLGDGVLSIRLFDLLVLALSSCGLVLGLRTLSTPSFARWTAVCFAFAYLSGTFYATAQPDGWVALAMVPALLPLATRPRDGRVGAFILCGLMLGCAVLVKQIYVALFLVPLVSWWSHRPTQSWRQLLALAAAAATPCLIVLFWLHRVGAWSAYIDAHFAYNAAYASVAEFALRERLTGAITSLGDSPIVAALFIPAAWGAFSLRRSPIALTTLGSWWLMSLALVMVQNKFFRYHWTLTMPPMLVLAAIGLRVRLGSSGSEPRGRPDSSPTWWMWAATAAMVVLCAVHPVWESARFVATQLGRVSYADYIDGFGIPGPSRRVSEYLREHTTPDERVLVWGLNADIHFLSEREPPGRFSFIVPIMIGAGTLPVQRYRDEYIRAVDARPPRFIIENTTLTTLFGYSTRMEDFQPLHDRVTTHYREVERFGNLRVLGRIASARDTAASRVSTVSAPADPTVR